MMFELSKDWTKKLQGRVEQYNFEVGVLEDKPHRFAEETSRFKTPNLGSFAGGPIRKATGKRSDQSIGDVLIQNMKRLNINILLRPFQEKNSDILRFTTAFLKYVVAKPGTSIRRVENLLQAVVRNPILKQEYGKNSAIAADNKGFDRHLIDTAQMFRAIKAKAKRV